MLYLLDREGVETGVDLDALIAVAKWLEALLGRELPGRVYRRLVTVCYLASAMRMTPAAASSAISSSA